ncbi:MAG: SDR family NAD(P)-dependent oxidoreductase, partial [Candidatus Thiodiazotropha sp.]
NISPREAEAIDPQERLFLQTVWHTLEDAGYTRAALRDSRVGVYVGVMYSQYQLFGAEELMKGHLAPAGFSYSSIANRVSYVFNFNGPSMALDTMCSSSLTALHLACESIRRGECEYAVAGGVNLSIHPYKYVLLSRSDFVSSDGRCRAFGEGGDGYVPGEGVGAVLLKPLARAVADGDPIHGVIRTSAVKSNIGHLESAAGIAGLTKVLLQMRHRTLVPSLHAQRENPHINFRQTPFRLQREVAEWLPAERRGDQGEPRTYPRRAGLSSFGAGGSNAHVIIEEYPGPRREVEIAGEQLVVLSARSPERLKAYAREMLNFLQGMTERENPPSLAELAYTLQLGREAMEERLALVASDMDDLQKQLAAFCTGKDEKGAIHCGNAKSGAGAVQLLTDSAAGGEFIVALLREQNWNGVARIWVAGLDIDWKACYPEQTPSRVSLPVYPFAQERCWIEISSNPLPAMGDSGDAESSLPIDPGLWKVDEGAAQGALPRRQPMASSDDAAELIVYEEAWEATDCQSIAPPAGDILVFDGDGELYESLQRRWAEREGPPVRWARVAPGESFAVEGDCYRLAPDDGEGYTRLLDELGFRPGLIVHAWNAGGYEAQRLAGQLERGVQSLFHLSRALLQRRTPEPVAIHCLADASSPLDLALGGFARTLRQEAPQCRCKVIAMAEADAAQRAARLLDEWGRDDESEIRYREGERQIRSLREAPPAPAAAPWRRAGVYLITGGLGGIGYQLAAHLLSRYQARLLLCGRGALDESRQAQLTRLRGLGGELFYLQADVADRREVEKLIASLKARYGALHGVIHAAGVLRDGFLLKKSAADLSAVLQPKVWGTQWLDLATRDEPLECFVLFSSTSAVMGNPGQADYAYANGFQDQYARWREVQGGAGRSLSLNWPLWESGGMALSEADRGLLYERTGLRPMPTAEGLRALERALAGTAPQYMPLYGERRRIAAALAGRREVVSAPQSAARIDRDWLSGECEKILRGLFQKILKLPAERIDPDMLFEGYGIDSIAVNQFNLKAEQALFPLPKTLLFEHTSLRALNDHLVAHYAEALAERLGVAAPLPPPATSPQPSEAHAESGQTAQDDGDAEAIAVIGMSGRFPGARDLHEYWDNLLAGRDSVGEIPPERWAWREHFDPDPQAKGKMYCKWGGFLADVDRFDPLFFGISPREAKMSDPQERLFLETAWETLEEAGYTRERLKRAHDNQVGVFVGVTTNSYQLLGAEHWGEGERELPNALPWSIANRVSYALNLNGPSLPVDTACSASLTALHLACESIRKGECRLALAGGVNLLLHPSKYITMCQMKMLSASGKCHSFGAGGDGFVRAQSPGPGGAD